MSDPQLNNNHVYIVTAINTKDDMITLTNPSWTGARRTVTLSLAELAANGRLRRGG